MNIFLSICFGGLSFLALFERREHKINYPKQILEELLLDSIILTTLLSVEVRQKRESSVRSSVKRLLYVAESFMFRRIIHIELVESHHQRMKKALPFHLNSKQNSLVIFYSFNIYNDSEIAQRQKDDIVSLTFQLFPARKSLFKFSNLLNVTSSLLN